MQEILRLQIKIVPELVEVLEKRYSMLRCIYYNQPIGRRVLANKLQLGERVIRTETGFLKDQNLISINAAGMTVTKDGEEIIEKLREFLIDTRDISGIEEKLKVAMGMDRVIVVPGDSDVDYSVLKEIAKEAASYLKSALKNDDILGITGGTMVKEVVNHISSNTQYKNVMVVPLRGGMGRNVETQANTLAYVLAGKLGGSYKMLHIPDNISHEVMESLMKEEEISETVKVIQKASIMLYGIGNAEHMAKKRGLSDNKIQKINSLGAVGEAYGCYFNEKGELVYSSPTLAMSIKDVKKDILHLAVAGGKKKAKAILSACRGNGNGILFIDEAAAEEILKLLSFENVE
ncbi:sugar-binding transcriptional regulator [Alloiococcus sp. CFN-8]|uniref:sugar-binding transcriptional regulator n=1 Tax=Alloiococcus sp. CFN-8 TaxID=3416081 RepID=UPI003CF0C4D2